MAERRPGWLACGAHSLLLLLTALWAALALHYQLPISMPWRLAAVAAWGLFALAALLLIWRGQTARAVLSYGLAFALLLGWWVRLAPSNERDWADDVARHLQPRVQGSQVLLQNVRNFDWRSETDYTARWEARRYDLDRLRSVDMGLSYWMGPAIAHTLVSFGFDDGRGGTEQVVFSIEIRKERHEHFSAVAGFFKQFELSLVAGDERDLLRVRTNVRGEDVYLYRVQMAPAAIRSLFLAYVAEAESLQRQPRFYDTLTANCTTIVYQMAQRIVGGLPLDWRLLASGYLPEYVHEVGALAPGQDLQALRSAGRITERAKAAAGDPQSFSRAIRAGMPGMP
ncbi:DUF4105 domain-containing protein [Xenophilus arseniciresistens]|uniref:DUF4105 domain-containing protein n=1 Tax=Xenophilus arseniciresistens TaxID=1283306 RepID=A0AAE3N6M5_9BURK|nr:DUF4105 domain-containing protein [Xenophilus arseniciresistens]MDA7414912.1 DUF4105 domain-containing protein [Xenophilus arseniciresistens]